MKMGRKSEIHLIPHLVIVPLAPCLRQAWRPLFTKPPLTEARARRVQPRRESVGDEELESLCVRPLAANSTPAAFPHSGPALMPPLSKLLSSFAACPG